MTQFTLSHLQSIHSSLTLAERILCRIDGQGIVQESHGNLKKIKIDIGDNLSEKILVISHYFPVQDNSFYFKLDFVEVEEDFVIKVAGGLVDGELWVAMEDNSELAKEHQKILQHRNNLVHSLKEQELQELQLEELMRDSQLEGARICHDLKTHIVGLDHLVSELQDDLSVKDFVSLSKLSLEKVENLCQSVIKRSEKKLKLNTNNFGDFYVSKLFKDLERLFKYPFLEKGLQLSFESDPEVRITSDFGKIYQILLNLISNSLKYSDKGTVTVAFERVSYSSLKFTVQDEGRGIKESQISKMFDDFYQVDSSQSGYGLGLAIVNSCIRKLEGKLTASSELNKGTTIEFVISSNQDNSSSFKGEKNQLPKRNVDLSKSAVLIYDDNPVILSLCGKYMSKFAKKVDLVGNITEFNSYLDNQRPNIVILDLNLENDINGNDVCQKLNDDLLMTQCIKVCLSSENPKNISKDHFDIIIDKADLRNMPTILNRYIAENLHP